MFKNIFYHCDFIVTLQIRFGVYNKRKRIIFSGRTQVMVNKYRVVGAIVMFCYRAARFTFSWSR